VALVIHRLSYRGDIPQVIPVPEGYVEASLIECRIINWLPCEGIALLGKFAITVQNVITPMLQFRGNRCLSCTRDAFD
jgi:hypothetical protein